MPAAGFRPEPWSFAPGKLQPGPGMTSLGLRLTPQGHLLCEPAKDAPPMDAVVATRLEAAFVQSAGSGLLQLGAGEVGRALPSGFRLVARFRDTLRNHFVPAISWRDGAGIARHPGTARSRACHAGAHGSDDAGIGVPDRRWAAQSVGRDGAGNHNCPRQQRHRPAGLPQAVEPGLEPGRPCAFQPRRKPP
ncbi:protein of unknown function (plasmid) [Rhodovastum atsumiense]|nr:protein of unknown function [Rhodovastum atsumiense]